MVAGMTQGDPYTLLPPSICGPCWSGHGETCEDYADPMEWCGCDCLAMMKAGAGRVGAGPAALQQEFMMSWFIGLRVGPPRGDRMWERNWWLG